MEDAGHPGRCPGLDWSGPSGLSNVETPAEGLYGPPARPAHSPVGGGRVRRTPMVAQGEEEAVKNSNLSFLASLGMTTSGDFFTPSRDRDSIADSIKDVRHA
jgi:hypothetical protein